MTRRSFAFLALLPFLPACAAPQPTRPKLVVGIVIDQFRYDYLTRFRADYKGGLDRLLRRGAVYTNARYEHYPTVTAVGHSIVMTGAMPSMTGIVENEWFDRETGKSVTSISDPNVKLLGGEGEGASPRNLMVSTLGDEMKMAWRGKTKVIGVSLKDRAAILPSGHMADGAYWFDNENGAVVSSTFYFADLPQWVKDFNKTRPADRYIDAEWKPVSPSPDFAAFTRKLPGPAGKKFYQSLAASPYANEMIELLAERAIEAERLGQRGETDLLTVSFSSNDYVGHAFGPDSPEVRDMAIRVDALLGRLLDYIDSRVGAGNSVVVLTADHGVAPVPEQMIQWKMPGGRAGKGGIGTTVEDALVERFGPGPWVSKFAGAMIYLDRKKIREKKLDLAEVERVAAAAIAPVWPIFRVYTSEQLSNGMVPPDPVSLRVVNGFYPRRTGDLILIGQPYWLTSGGSGTTHGSPFEYDSHVPLIVFGAGIKPGRYNRDVRPNDIAPTLATMLDVATPGGAVGRVLTEVLVTE